MNKKRVAIIGTNGIPANYGGFETLVEYLVDNLSDTLDITVFCSTNVNEVQPKIYKGATLQYIRLSANGWQSILFDFLSLFYSYKKFDKVLILGCSGSIFQPLFFFHRKKLIMNLGGLDWQRSKWNYLTRQYLKLSEKLAIKYSGKIISDNEGIKQYLLQEYGVDSTVIAYGGDQVFAVKPKNEDRRKYSFLNNKYAFTVARIQADNNIEMLCDSFLSNPPLPLVLVGNWNASIYGKSIRNKYKNYSGLILLDAIYDQHELNLLRSNCYVYIHGHSAGGTNPALVEAMNLKVPIFAFNNSFNKYTTHNSAKYFSSSAELSQMLQTIKEDELVENANQMFEIAKIEYVWVNISKEYLKVLNA